MVVIEGGARPGSVGESRRDPERCLVSPPGRTRFILALALDGVKAGADRKAA
jgi:hypothetical protein